MYGAESGTVGLWQRGTANHPRAQREPAGGGGVGSGTRRHLRGEAGNREGHRGDVGTREASPVPIRETSCFRKPSLGS